MFLMIGTAESSVQNASLTSSGVLVLRDPEELRWIPLKPESGQLYCHCQEGIVQIETST